MEWRLKVQLLLHLCVTRHASDCVHFLTNTQKTLVYLVLLSLFYKFNSFYSQIILKGLSVYGNIIKLH